MLNGEIYGLSFSNIVFMFFIYSFLGWLWEVFFVFLRQDKLVNRGFLNGPFCPIYGVGAVSVTFALMPFEDNILSIFIVGSIIATIVEYAAATVMELLFKSKWWDYSDKKYNIKGRVCLSISIGWGFFSIILMKVLNPLVMDFIVVIPETIEAITLIVMTMTFILDFSYTFYYIKKFNKQLEHMSISKDALRIKLESSKLYETSEEIRARIESSDSEFVIEIRDRLKAFNKANTEDWENLLEELKELKLKYNKDIKDITSVEKRLLKAFPKLKTIKNNDILKEIKERLNK